MMPFDECEVVAELEDKLNHFFLGKESITMSLIINNIGKLTVEDLEKAFEAQFEAVVMAEVTTESFWFCTARRKAVIYIHTSSIELHRFMRMMERNGSCTLVVNKAAYTIRLNNLSQIMEEHIV